MSVDFAAWLRSANRSPIALVEIDYINEVGGAPSTSTLYYSTKSGFVSRATDTPANQPYLACISKLPTFTRSLDRQRLGGVYSVSFGQIEIANGDGSHDAMLGYAFDGSYVRVYYGDLTWAKADFELMFMCVGASIGVPTDPRTIVFNVKDPSYNLDRNIGGNPMGGSGPNASKPVPLNLGFVHNVEALLEDPSTNTYRYSDTRTDGILLAKRDNGDAIPGGLGDHGGAFDLGSAPVGKVTADAIGYNASYSTGFKTSDIYNTLIKWFAGYYPTPHSTFVPGSDYDYPLGLSIREPRNLWRDVLLDVANSSNTFYGFTRLGSFTYGRIFPYNPSAAPVLELVADDIRPANAIKIEAVVPLYNQIFCTGNRNWTVQSEDSLSGILSQVAKATYTRSGYAYSQPTPTGTDYTSNPGLYHLTMGPSGLIETLISQSDDASALPYLVTFAEQYRRKFLSWLQLIDVNVRLHAYSLELGDIVRLTLPRFGLDEGPVMQVTSITIDLDKETVSLTLAYRRSASVVPPVTDIYLMEDGSTRIYMEDGVTPIDYAGASSAEVYLMEDGITPILMEDNVSQIGYVP